MNVEKFRLPPFKKWKTKPKTKDPFLKGPIPLRWILCAAALPGKSLHVALALWYLAGVRRSKAIKFSYKRAVEFGTNRYAAYRGLQALERANLIKMEKGRGRTPKVFLEEVDSFVEER